MKQKSRWMILTAAALLMTGSAAAYINNYYRADQTAQAALISDNAVEITATDYGWYFDGPSEDTAMIFYPGGKVEETAYAPLLHEIADEGTDVCLCRMPFRLAVMDINKAADVMEQYGYTHWYIGVHSLGGACASYFAGKHEDQLDGIILLAAYSARELDLDALLIYGSEDGVLNIGRYQKNLDNLPEDAQEVIIQGGNHCQFGSYGFQKGDNEADLSAAQQIQKTVQEISRFIAETNRKDS